jgi:hypothetical protein
MPFFTWDASGASQHIIRGSSSIGRGINADFSTHKSTEIQCSCFYFFGTFSKMLDIYNEVLNKKIDPLRSIFKI